MSIQPQNIEPVGKVLHGIVHGRTIELSELPGVTDGQEVEVVVRHLNPKRPWGEGIRNSAGGWAECPEMDAIMETIQQSRKLKRRSQV